jgi:group I intron endonuclease
MNNINKKIKPVVCYINAEKYKFTIYRQNKNKSGIYKWTNIKTGKFYIGSSMNLTERFKFYFCPKCLIGKLLKSRSYIYDSLLRDGYSNFNLEILEYCDVKILLEREQYYFNILNPEYNIRKRIR